MSIESWIDGSVLILAFLLLTMAGLVDASLNKRQRLTIRELLDNGSNDRHTEAGVDHNSDRRAAVDVAMLLSVLVIGVVATHLTTRFLALPWLLAVIPGAVILVLVAGRLIPILITDRYDIAESSGVERIASTLSALMGPFIVVLKAGRIAFERPTPSPFAEAQANEEPGDEQPNDADSDESTSQEIRLDEHEMISGILSLEEAYSREIMVPRPDMVAVAIDTPIPDVVQIAQEAGHSRIPVYEDSIDQIRGIVYAKDLLRFVNDEVVGVELTDLMRPAQFVPESKRVDNLLRDLQRARVHLAIVVDEYGGTAGLVTIEDIIEEIVGEIQDEYDRELPLYEYASEGDIVIDGRMSVDELSELTGVQLPDTESETVGGLVARALGHIPEQGDVAEIGTMRIQVESVERRRVRSIRVWIRGDLASLGTQDPVQVT